MSEKRSVGTWIVLAPLLLLCGGVVGFIAIMMLGILIEAAGVVGSL